MIEQFDITGNEKIYIYTFSPSTSCEKKGLCYKAVVKTEESGPLNLVRIYVLSQIIIDGNDCLLV